MTHASRVRAVTKTGLPDAIIGDDLRHGEILNANYQPDGRMRPEEAQRLMPITEADWPVAGTLGTGQLTKRLRLGQPKRLEHLAAYVMTAPTTGPVVLWLTGQSPTRAPYDIASVTIRVNESYGEIAIPSISIPAGIYVGVRVASAGGASGLTLTAALRGEA